jgi:hypothetical protein
MESTGTDTGMDGGWPGGHATSIGRGVVHVQLQSFCYLHPDND